MPPSHEPAGGHSARPRTDRPGSNTIVREADAALATMLDCVGIYSAMRALDGRIVGFRVDYVNDAACQNNRLTEDQQVGRGLCELLPAHRDSGLFDAYVRLVETGAPVVLQDFAYEDVYGDGQRLQRLFDLRATRLDDGFVAVWRDVSARRAVEDTIRFQSDLLQAVEQAVIATDLEGTITFWNRHAEVLYGWRADEVLGRSVLEITPS